MAPLHVATLTVKRELPKYDQRKTPLSSAALLLFFLMNYLINSKTHFYFFHKVLQQKVLRLDYIVSQFRRAQRRRMGIIDAQ